MAHHDGHLPFLVEELNVSYILHMILILQKNPHREKGAPDWLYAP